MSAETKQPWTPGPWRSDYDEVDAFADIYAVGQGDNGCSLHLVDVRGPNAKADGILMAAAPALAEALVAMVLTTVFTSTDAASYELESLSRDDFDSDADFERARSELIALVVAHKALDSIGWRWS